MLVLSIAFVAWFALHVVTEWDAFATRETGEAFLLPALLAVMSLPITYALGVISAYEQIFWRLGFGQPPRNWARTKLRISLACGLRLQRIERFLQFALPGLRSERRFRAACRALDSNPPSAPPS
jgi:hypothetical protein